MHMIGTRRSVGFNAKLAYTATVSALKLINSIYSLLSSQRTGGSNILHFLISTANYFPVLYFFLICTFGWLAFPSKIFLLFETIKLSKCTARTCVLVFLLISTFYIFLYAFLIPFPLDYVVNFFDDDLCHIKAIISLSIASFFVPVFALVSLTVPHLQCL